MDESSYQQNLAVIDINDQGIRTTPGEGVCVCVCVCVCERESE